MGYGVIEGVVIHQLTRHADDCGYFDEIIRVDDTFFAEGFGQWSRSKMFLGVVKAWHIRESQIDWWYAGAGRLRVALHDVQQDSPTHGTTQESQMGDDLLPIVLNVPAGVAHGCKVLGQQPAHLF
jgi:dTDP-4-dehydrorhamnose 3,5-epimerase